MLAAHAALDLLQPPELLLGLGAVLLQDLLQLGLFTAGIMTLS